MSDDRKKQRAKCGETFAFVREAWRRRDYEPIRKRLTNTTPEDLKTWPASVLALLGSTSSIKEVRGERQAMAMRLRDHLKPHGGDARLRGFGIDLEEP